MSDRFAEHPRLTRRLLLQAGAVGILGLGTEDLRRLRAEAADSPAAAPARSVIFVFLSGGLSQLDTFDTKPQAAAEVRGEFQPAATQTPGVEIVEHLPLLAQSSRLWSLCRSLAHNEQSHGPACHSMLSGRTELPAGVAQGCGAPPTRLDWPGIAALANYTLPSRNNLPPAVLLPPPRLNVSTYRPGSFGGQMGGAHDPWSIEPCLSPLHGCLPDGFDWKYNDEQGWYVVPAATPDVAGFFRPPSLTLPDDVGEDRFAKRLELLGSLEDRRRLFDAATRKSGFDAFRERAVSLLSGRGTQSALFDVRNAPPQEQDRYGRNEWGWLLLLARRLVEARIPLIQVTLGRNGCWDTHRDNFRLLRQRFLPPFDRGLSALLEDLAERGLLDETLVVVASEFGRTPRIIRHENGRSEPGRDHWARVQTILLAGGGIQGGRVVGSSDAIGGEPASDRQTPENFAATIFHALGIPRERTWHAEEDAAAGTNPQPVYHGEPIDGLM